MYAPFCFWADPVVLGSTEILLKYPTCEQSHYREVPRWEIFMEQELRFGLDLDRLALLKKKRF